MVEKISHKNNRETFSSKFGFVISCIGAALGLGNIWMFSYRLGTYGGAVFLIPYFLFVFLLLDLLFNLYFFSLDKIFFISSSTLSSYFTITKYFEFIFKPII